MNTALTVVVIVTIVALSLPTTLALRYTVHNTKVQFFEAWTQCINNGGYLASSETAYEQAAIVSAIQKSGAPSSEGWWLSGTDEGMEGSWIWLSRNVPVAIVGGYTNWASTEPNNVGGAENCLITGIDSSFKWYDKPCDNTYYYVCEYYSA
uniref:C-type lectin domain-containing protein n=1 Tax=Anopheles dirus TaxID=7168 RepID=A0A182NYC7_9DIPT